MSSPAEGKDETEFPYSTLSLAFASLIFLNKPPELSVREFIYYLRGCLQKDPKSSPLHHVSNDAYWRNVCKDKDHKILELDQRLIDANLENERLLAQIKGQGVTDTGAADGSKTKTGAATPKVYAYSTNNKFMEWEPVRDTYDNLSSGQETIFFLLRSLHYAKADETKPFTVNIIKLCKAVSSKIHNICTEDKTTDAGDKTSSQQYRRTRQSDTARMKQKLIDTAWVAGITKAFDDIFRRLFMAVARLSFMLEKEEPQIQIAARNGAAEAVSELFCSVLDSIHKASRRFNNESLTRTRDIRTGCVTILQSFISTLNGEDELQGYILEAIIYVIVEATGKCLCIPKFPNTTDQEVSEKEGEALRETSVYVLRLLKVTLPLYRIQLANSSMKQGMGIVRNPSTIMRMAKQKFHQYIMKGLFGDQRTPDWNDMKSYNEENISNTTKGTWGGVGIHDDFLFVDEKEFADQVWELLELEDFCLVW